MDARKPSDTQSLTVSGTNMSGEYIQGSNTGTANITLENNAQADMIEVGADIHSTNTNIIIDDSILNGEQDSVEYKDHVGDKNYMMGAAIFIDPLDNGEHNVDVRNNSQLHGSIISGGGASQTINMENSSLDKGGIYALSYASDNTVSLTNAQIDASQSPVAQEISAIAQQISEKSPFDIPLQMSNFDDMAIGMFSTENNLLSLNQSDVTGDIGLLNQAGLNLISMTDSTVDGSVMLASNTGETQLNASGSSITGDVTLSGSGQMQLALSNQSIIKGDLTLEDPSTPSLKRQSGLGENSDTFAQVSLSDSAVQGNLRVDKSDAQVSVALDNSSVGGDLTVSTGEGDTALTLQNNSQVGGDVTLEGSGNAQVMISGSQLNGDLDTSANVGDTSIIIGDTSTVAGNVTTGAGSDSIVVAGGSKVEGNIDGGSGTNNLILDNNSSVDGGISNVNAVYATQNNSIVTPNIDSGTNYSLMNGSMLVGQTMSDANITMSTDSAVVVTGAATGMNTLTISQMAEVSHEGTSVVGSFNDLSQGTVNYQFANGEQQVAARSGAWNYDVTASTVDMNNPTAGSEIVVTQKHTGLANDVKGMIAGLDGAKQSGQAVVADIANRMDNLRSSYLLNGVSEGQHIWGDYLYQNGNYSDDVDYHSNLQGFQGGVDWSHLRDNGDVLTGGIALAYTRNRVSEGDTQGNFDNSVYGNFYSVYGGWQQHLRDNHWGLFIDGSFSYGDMRYSMSAHNVQSSTTGIQEALNGTYNGNMYDAETRAGVNIKNAENMLIQPYAVLGWNKVESNAFSDAQISFGKNQVSSMHAGGGMRISGDIAAANMHIMPWADARYISELNDDSTVNAADYRANSGHNQKMAIVGAGVNVGVTSNLQFTSGVYTGGGDVDNSVSVQAGFNFRF
ncbi:uncharacterized protein with beta-barrel porin domain [Enterobacter sp. BIGb0383]|nr:uncharacterized protein with beta-barrel porin domain [Enterobacter sp. BIGb0383]ROS06384.1 uncharacterized protein with beta-barrel porin domain [Enterobacter sp. BIGb0359]